MTCNVKLRNEEPPYDLPKPRRHQIGIVLSDSLEEVLRELTPNVINEINPLRAFLDAPKSG
jgi:hypothetical protein